MKRFVLCVLTMVVAVVACSKSPAPPPPAARQLAVHKSVDVATPPRVAPTIHHQIAAGSTNPDCSGLVATTLDAPPIGEEAVKRVVEGIGPHCSAECLQALRAYLLSGEAGIPPVTSNGELTDRPLWRAVGSACGIGAVVIKVHVVVTSPPQ